MKHKKYISLLFIPFFLASCGNAGAETKLPNSGTKIDSTVGKEKLKLAIKSEMAPDENKSDAFGFSISGAHFSENVDGSISVANQEFASITSKVEAKNGKFDFGVKGITSKSCNDFRAILSAGIDINGSTTAKYNTNIDVLTSDAKADMPATSVEFKGVYKASANILENNLYLDLSNKQMLSFINTYIGNLAETIPVSGKVKLPLGLKDEEFPLIDADDIAEFDAKYNEFFKKLPEGGEFKDHGKAGFSYSGKLGKEDIEKEVSDNTADNNTSTSATFTANADSYFSYALVFKETGLVSFGIDASVGFDISAGLSSDGIPGYEFAAAGNAEFGAKFEFLRGSDVKFPEVKTEEFEEPAEKIS